MNPFGRLAPFIQEFIWRRDWKTLRAMQVDAISAVLDTDDHVLLAGGTASGKTEAAFLPILTQLTDNPPASVGVLYVGPLKALINDQFERLSELLEESGTPVWPWHGEVSQSTKRAALKERRGVLQTTPESLEGFFVYRSNQLAPLFHDLRFVVIDEVHAFMSSDRGRQILCQLARLERLVGTQPRRVGLSATLGDYSLASAWLAGGSTRPVQVLGSEAEGKTIRLGMAHYTMPSEEAKRHDHDDRTAYFDHLFRLTRGRKSLVFVNSRVDAEEVGAELRARGERTHQDNQYFVHHGSISKDYRLEAEEAMRAPGRPACTVATVTLELGIDLGQLERVIQIGPSPSVSSFVQRLGRTGRRDGTGEMFFFDAESAPDPSAHPLEQMPWGLLVTTAQIQLYLEERFIETARPPRRPYSLLYQQLMSTLLQEGDMPPSVLAERVLALPPLREVTHQDFEAILRHLVELDHLQWTEESTLLIGLEGERITNDWRFLATFEDVTEYKVVSGARHVGSIADAPPVDTVFRLAGRSWRVEQVDESRRIISVTRAAGAKATRWMGDYLDQIHERVVRRLRQVLLEDVHYPYMMPNAHDRLSEARTLARTSGILSGWLHPFTDSRVALTPWMGSDATRALVATIAARSGQAPATRSAPFYVVVQGDESSIRSMLVNPTTSTELLEGTKGNLPGRYVDFIPEELRRLAFIEDYVDVQRANAVLADHVQGRGV